MFSSLEIASASSEHLKSRHVVKASSGESGAPRRHASSGATGLNCCRVGCSIHSSDRVMISHFSRLSCSPIKPHSFSICLTSSATTADAPPNDRSSRKPSVSVEDQFCRIGCNGRQNNSGPSGSPCWGPTCERSVYFPNCSIVGSAYASRLYGVSSGAISSNARSMRSLCRLLNAFLKSSLTKTDPVGISLRNLLAAWHAASAPPGTPTPTCHGARYVAAFWTVLELAPLDDSRRQ